mmetsp:Transcript_13730/g.37556  ORF Transcript_13730/g.37556 Transcript_13730/m.37556 type:complete len:113 (+) Transcript_13730:593-931(+)
MPSLCRQTCVVTDLQQIRSWLWKRMFLLEWSNSDPDSPRGAEPGRMSWRELETSCTPANAEEVSVELFSIVCFFSYFLAAPAPILLNLSRPRSHVPQPAVLARLRRLCCGCQ